MSIIDFHSHILPGIDDGSRDAAMTAQMLQSASAQGIRTIVATPHFYADSTTIERFLRHRQRALDEVQEIAARNQIRIVCGAETAFFSEMSRAENLELLCFNNTNLIMVEMPFRGWTARDLREIEMLLRRGLRPVIAHLERFYQFQTDKGMIPELLDMPVYIQINAGCLLHWNRRRQAIKLFKDGQAHLLGSDCHNISTRPENLAEGRAVLEKKLGRQALRRIDRLGKTLLGANIDEGT